MNRMIRTVAAIAVVSLVFQARLTASPKGVKPAKATVAKPMPAPAGSKPAKSAHAPVTKTTAGPAVKPVKSTKASAPAMKSSKPSTKADMKAAKTTAKTTKVTAKSTAKADAKSAKAAAPAMKSSKASTKADMKAAKTTAKTTKGTAKSDTKLAKSTTKADAKLAKSTAKADARSATHSSTTTTGTTSTPIVVSNPLADKISGKPKLAAKIASRLPSDMTLAQATTGFKNQGQFIAAVNVSNNLGIDFVKLQTAMTGQTVKVDPKTHAITTTPTGDAPLSLGRAIQTLKPGVDADAAVQKAQTQTSQMVQ